jgi:hypothetical protein
MKTRKTLLFSLCICLAVACALPNASFGAVAAVTVRVLNFISLSPNADKRDKSLQKSFSATLFSTPLRGKNVQKMISKPLK